MTDFLNQPVIGWGKSWSLAQEVPVNTTYIGIVAREVDDGDFEHATKPAASGGGLDYYRDGRPKVNMKVPMYCQPDNTHPEGRAILFVNGTVGTELKRAMDAAGAPASLNGIPEKGAVIKLVKAGQRRNSFNSWSAVPHIDYTRPEGAAPAPPVVEQPAPPVVEQPAPPVVETPNSQHGEYTGAPPQAPIGQAQPPLQTPPVVEQPAPPVQQAAAPPADPEKAALLDRLTAAQNQK